MSLLDELSEHTSKPGPDCTIAIIIASLAEQDASDLRAALLDRRFRGSAIGAVLRKRGFVVGDPVIQRHRRGTCRCPSPTN